ncbi:class I SAM-dependent methyltransferase [Streptomyces sp. NPDC090306]|uniref:class I SAM-dependent methyltransferase n=1 Tax=unclassified Streptomyces TaxID=2593676 RepID=UPI0036F01259
MSTVRPAITDPARVIASPSPSAPARHAQDAPGENTERLWSRDDVYSEALRTGDGPLFLRRTDGWLLPLEIERWCAAADATDLAVLHRCEGSVLDVGCGPGRLVSALATQGRRSLGIDVSEAAVARTRRFGGPALQRSVFEPLPAEGRWGTVLLIDGNIGIGGDPCALLHRVGQLLRPGGLLVAETAPADIDERVTVRIVPAPGVTRREERAGAGSHDTADLRKGSAFPWARLGTTALLRHAAHAGWLPCDQWTDGGRCFVSLRTRTNSSSAETPNSTAVISSQ